MELTIMKPAVTEPSHIPRMKRTAKRPAKFLQAAWLHKAIAQMNMFRLETPLQKMRSPIKACTTYLIHFPTGNLCSAKFCGNSKAR